MDYISVMTVCLDSAFGMIVFRTAFSVYPVMDEVSCYTCDNGQYKEYCKKQERLIRDHCKHHEGFVAR